MKLRSIKIKQFANLVDQELKVDPKVTVLIGKNEIGKTNLLLNFLEQHYSVGVGWGDRYPAFPNMPTRSKIAEFALKRDGRSKMEIASSFLAV